MSVVMELVTFHCPACGELCHVSWALFGRGINTVNHRCACCHQDNIVEVLQEPMRGRDRYRVAITAIGTESTFDTCQPDHLVIDTPVNHPLGPSPLWPAPPPSAPCYYCSAAEGHRLECPRWRGK